MPVSKPKHSKPKVFSDQLEGWMKGSQPKTLDTLIKQFGDKSFAVIMLLLMAVPATPLPTAGVTHVFEVVVALLALEQIAGLKSIWLPKALSSRIKLGLLAKGKFPETILRLVRRLERHSSPRAKWIFTLPLVDRFVGLLSLIFAATAFFAIPLSGLDTLPSLGVVILSLSVLLDDAVLLLVGTVIGVAGVTLSVGFGAAAFEGIKRII